MFFLVYFSNAPLLVRLATRALLRFLPLLSASQLAQIPLPSDNRFVVKTAVNLEEVLRKLAVKLPADAYAFSLAAQPIIVHRFLDFAQPNSAVMDAGRLKPDNFTLVLEKIGSLILNNSEKLVQQAERFLSSDSENSAKDS